MNLLKLKVKLLENKMSQIEFANALDISYQSLYSRFTEKTAFTLDETKKIKNALNLTDDEYLDIFEIE